MINDGKVSGLESGTDSNMTMTTKRYRGLYYVMYGCSFQ